MEVPAVRLFTSNSKYHEIFKICAYTMLIAVFYYGGVYFIPKDLKGANQWQTNIIKAQDFVFDNKAYTHVFVGSSEAYNVPVEEISDKWANLGLASGCSLTGLEIILRSGKPVDVVFVEVNTTLMRGKDDALLSEVEPWHILPIGRQNTRIDYLFNLIKTKLKMSFKSKNTSEIKDDDKVTNLSGLDIQKESMSKPLNEEKMRQVLSQLKEQVDELRLQGVKIILTETPNDPSLRDLQQSTMARNLVHEYFPVGEYDYFDVDWNDYKTSDGVHLTEYSAKRYAQKMTDKY